MTRRSDTMWWEVEGVSLSCVDSFSSCPVSSLCATTDAVAASQRGNRGRGKGPGPEPGESSESIRSTLSVMSTLLSIPAVVVVSVLRLTKLKGWNECLRATFALVDAEFTDAVRDSRELREANVRKENVDLLVLAVRFIANEGAR